MSTCAEHRPTTTPGGTSETRAGVGVTCFPTSSAANATSAAPASCMEATASCMFQPWMNPIRPRRPSSRPPRGSASRATTTSTAPHRKAWDTCSSPFATASGIRRQRPSCDQYATGRISWSTRMRWPKKSCWKASVRQAFAIQSEDRLRKRALARSSSRAARSTRRSC